MYWFRSSVKSTYSIGLIALVVLLAACGVPRPVVKIALVAPFEGRFREVGYAAFPAFRLALREQIEAGGIGQYEVAFVAYNDNADVELARHVASSVILDEQVVAVIGHLRVDTTVAAMGIYTNAQMAVVIPDIPADMIPSDPFALRLGPTTSALGQSLAKCPQNSSDATITSSMAFKGRVSLDAQRLLPDLYSDSARTLMGEAYRGLCFANFAPYPADMPAAMTSLGRFSEVSGGAEPSQRSISAYDATRLILEAIKTDIAAHGRPTRVGVAEALRHSDYAGLLGRIQLNKELARETAPVWLYWVNAVDKPEWVR